MRKLDLTSESSQSDVTVHEKLAPASPEKPAVQKTQMSMAQFVNKETPVASTSAKEIGTKLTSDMTIKVYKIRP